MRTLSFFNSIDVVFIGIAGLALIWLIALTFFVWRFQKARKQVGATVAGDPELFDVITKALEDIEGLTAGQERSALAIKRNRGLIGAAPRHIGLVRFDAFPEVGGRLSFSLALLNDEGEGIVLSAISGRDDSRIYAKPIVGRKSEFALSGEEEEAIRRAYEDTR